MTLLNPQRDQDLDTYRGIAMIWVLLIHTFYWLGIVSNQNLAISYFLLEMPLFFFIAGASNSLGKRKSLVSFYKSRLRRILIPYWVYAALCIFLTELAIAFLGQPDQLSYLEWLIPRNRAWTPYNFLTWQLWFIPVYILLMSVFPLLRWVSDRLSASGWRYAPLVLLGIAIWYIDKHPYSGAWQQTFYYARTVIFYCFWVYLGTLYISFKNKPWPKPLLLATGLLGLLGLFVLIQYFGYPSNMQSNKFPPNLAFLFMNIGYFGLLALMKKPLLHVLKRPVFKSIIDTYSSYGYTIYLYHPFGFLLFRILSSKLHTDAFLYSHKFLGLLISFIFIVLSGIPIAKLFGKVEKW